MWAVSVIVNESPTIVNSNNRRVKFHRIEHCFACLVAPKLASLCILVIVCRDTLRSSNLSIDPRCMCSSKYFYLTSSKLFWFNATSDLSFFLNNDGYLLMRLPPPFPFLLSIDELTFLLLRVFKCVYYCPKKWADWCIDSVVISVTSSVTKCYDLWLVYRRVSFMLEGGPTFGENSLSPSDRLYGVAALTSSLDFGLFRPGSLRVRS